MNKIKLLLAGEGGQGIQTIAKIITEAADKEGHEVVYIPIFGVEQRGTPSVGFITIDKVPIRYPRFDIADYVVILQQRALEVVKQYIGPDTKVIFDSSTVPSEKFEHITKHLYGIPATKLAAEQYTPRAFNVLVTGKLATILNLDKEIVWESVSNILGKKFKSDEIRQANHDAFDAGGDYTFEQGDFTEASFMPSTETIISKGHGKTAMLLPKYCKGCGICVDKCPVKAIGWSETLGVFATPAPEIDMEKCIGCGTCTRVCPDAAIRVVKDK